jgi:HSP20 family molecular chaperone IbpA
MALPVNVGTHNIEPNLHAGVLTVRGSKTEQAKPQRIVAVRAA